MFQIPQGTTSTIAATTTPAAFIQRFCGRYLNPADDGTVKYVCTGPNWSPPLLEILFALLTWKPYPVQPSNLIVSHLSCTICFAKQTYVHQASKF